MRPVVIPYLHKGSRNLKNVVSRFDVPMVFEAPCKLSSVCRRVMKLGGPKQWCNKQHEDPFGRCSVGVVYVDSVKLQ